LEGLRLKFKKDDYKLLEVMSDIFDGILERSRERQFAKEFYIKINNVKYKNEVLKLMNGADWVKLYNLQPTYNLLQWQVYKYLKECIPELE
jgi:hypothetical protein